MDDRRMRNGSMIAVKAGGSQGYDSRPRNFNPASSVQFPCTLQVNQSLVSTVSNPDVNVSNFVHALMWPREQRSQLALRAAAVLTCLGEAPPADAFRPPYAGIQKPLHRLADLKWDRLPKLAPIGDAPAAGEIGGWITPAAEPAYYAKRLPARTLSDGLTASGELFVEKGAGHTLIGFFNASTLNEWGMPNSIVLRIHQRGDVFHCHLEYCTGKWRAGAGIIGVHDQARDRMNAKELPSGRVYSWSIPYNVRPRFDFGYSRTQHAGGQALGELGGLFFRGDCRYGERLV